MGADASVTTMGASATGVYALNGGVIEMSSAEISVGANSHSLFAQNTSDQDNSRITGNGRFTISGSIAAHTTSTGSALVDMTMTDGSVFTGATSTNAANAEIGLTMSGVDSVWNVTEESSITNLTLDGSYVNYTNSPQFITITAKNLSGNSGMFIMKTDVVNKSADQLIVTGTESGSHTIQVLNDGSVAATGDEVVMLARTTRHSGGFTLFNEVDIGAWAFSLREVDEEDSTHWDLFSTRQSSDPGSGAINNFIASYLMSYAETETLIQRLGDLRQSSFVSGLWFRAHCGRFESNAKSYVKPFNMDYGGVQIGYNHNCEIDTEGDFYGCIVLGYSKGDLDYMSGGRGKADSKMLSVYGTFIKQNGFYADLMLKYQWIKNDFDVIDTAGTLVRGDGVTTGGFGVSIEFDQKISFGKERNTGWYAKPRIQLSYMR